MNLETKITIYKFTPQLFTLTRSGIYGIHEDESPTCLKGSLVVLFVIEAIYEIASIFLSDPPGRNGPLHVDLFIRTALFQGLLRIAPSTGANQPLCPSSFRSAWCTVSCGKGKFMSFSLNTE